MKGGIYIYLKLEKENKGLVIDEYIYSLSAPLIVAIDICFNKFLVFYGLAYSQKLRYSNHEIRSLHKQIYLY